MTGGRDRPVLSVVIPTLDEAESIAALLGDLASLRVAHEVIVADGGSADATRDIAASLGARVVLAGRGRGTQLRSGAGVATAPVLLFLHADVRLPPAARAELLLFLQTSGTAACFRLAIDSPRRAYRVIEMMANLRTRWLRLPYGDQGLLISRERYAAVGGFADVPLMEDVVMARALSRSGAFELLDACVVVSARRWERDGVWHRSLANVVLLARFLGGASLHDLAAAYRR